MQEVTTNCFVPLQDRINLQDEKIHQFLEQIRVLEETSSRQQAEFLSEVAAQKRLADLYKSHLDEATASVERLEEMNDTWKENYAKQAASFKTRLAEQVAKAEAVIAKTEEEAAQQIKALQAELDTVRQQQTSREGASSVGPATVVPPDFEELGVTEMYDRVVRAEKELVQEQCRRGELELYLDRILKDVQSKAPLIASQRKDYMRVLESHAQLTNKLDNLVSENHSLKQKIERLERENKEALLEARSLEMQNKDLGQQIQHLLKRQSGVPTSAPSARGGASGTAEGVISEYLVTFDDIDELQTRNMQLLKVVRKLSTEQEEALGSTAVVAVDDTQAELQEALTSSIAELKQMRESRQRMEEMVASLVQQRDIYRAMLEEVDGGAPVGSGTTPAKAITSGTPRTPSSPAASASAAISAAKANEDMRMKLAEVTFLSCYVCECVLLCFCHVTYGYVSA